MSREIILEAIENTKHFNAKYWEKSIKQRAGLWFNGYPNSFRAGSYYPELNPEEVEKALLQAFWTPLKSENVRPDFETFTTPLPGLLGVVPLHQLPADTELKVDDRKETGFAHLTFTSDQQVLADDTTIIISKKATSWKVVTFFPGLPVEGQNIPLSSITKETLSSKEAIEMGFKHAKLVKKTKKNSESPD